MVTGGSVRSTDGSLAQRLYGERVPTQNLENRQKNRPQVDEINKSDSRKLLAPPARTGGEKSTRTFWMLDGWVVCVSMTVGENQGSP